MKKVITLVLHNRPDYTKIVLNALRRCDGVEEYLILPHIEPGNKMVLSLAKSINFAKVQITLNKRKLGIARNTYKAWEHGFKKADFIIHLEDDTVPARDCLRYMEHCAEAYQDDPKIFSISGYNRSSCKPFQYYQIARRNPFACWAVGLWKNRWEWARKRWSRDRDLYAVHLNNELTKFELKEIYPLLSRAQNIGSENGIHVPSVEWHRQNQHTDYWAGNHDLRPGKYFEPGPLVTAVMVTGIHKERYSLARAAAECFKKQTYVNKELLIINVGGESVFCGDARVRELRLEKSKTDTIDDLRNLGIKYAAGDFIINWNDDDWHHPKRIETQMAAQKKDGAAVLLKNRIHYSFKNHCAFYDINPQGEETTILHPKTMDSEYPIVRTRDALFSSRFKKCVGLDNDPSLLVGFCHDFNSCDSRHIMRHLADPKIKNEFQINPEHQRFLKKVLLRCKGENF